MATSSADEMDEKMKRARHDGSEETALGDDVGSLLEAV